MLWTTFISNQRFFFLFLELMQNLFLYYVEFSLGALNQVIWSLLSSKLSLFTEVDFISLIMVTIIISYEKYEKWLIKQGKYFNFKNKHKVQKVEKNHNLIISSQFFNWWKWKIHSAVMSNVRLTKFQTLTILSRQF